MPWVIPYAVMAIVAIGSYWYASSLDYPNLDGLGPDTTVSPSDTGSAFAAFPTYPSSEFPVPVVYGCARLNGLVVHFRPYGDNLEKCHVIVVWGDTGYSLNQIYVDKYPIEDLPNYYENVGGGQNTTNTWTNFYPTGGPVQISLNNTGTFGVMMSANTPQTLTASQPAIFYGGGSIKVQSTHTWPTPGSAQRWRWRLINLGDITETMESGIYDEIFYSEQHLTGGDKADSEDIPIAGSQIRSHTFNVPDPLTKWSVSLELLDINNTIAGASVIFYNFEIVDIHYIESYSFNATFSHVHIVRDVAVTGAQPVISAEVQKSDNGNPAQSLYEYLTCTTSGLGIPNVDYASISTMASWCEAEGYFYNRAIAAFYNDGTILKEMCTCGRIILYEENGKVKMRPDKQEITSYLIDDTEIVTGSLTVGLNAKTAANRVEGQYTEPFYGYTVERVYAEDHDDIILTGQREVTVGLAGCTSQLQAHNLTHLALNHITKSKYWCKFNTGLETASMFKIGDVVEITSETNAIVDGKKWRVQKIEERELFEYSISCSHYTDEIYEFPPFSPWYEDVTELTPIHGWPGADTGAATVINIVFNSIDFQQGCNLSTNISLSWTNPTERFDYASVFWSHDNINWHYSGMTTSGYYSFSWPMRYGKLFVKIASYYTSNTGVRHDNYNTAPIVSQYITGDALCTGDDYPGYGVGQYGWVPRGA